MLSLVRQHHNPAHRLSLPADVQLRDIVWVNAPTATHQQVWFNFQNNGGWSSTGLAMLVGQLTAFVSQPEGISHI